MELRTIKTTCKIPLMTKEDLRRFREQFGLSQDDLAKELKVARNTVSRWELGNAKIPEFLDLALQTVKRGLKKQETLKAILYEATRGDKSITEDELISKLDSVGFFDDLDEDEIKQSFVEFLKNSNN